MWSLLTSSIVLRSDGARGLATVDGCPGFWSCQCDARLPFICPDLLYAPTRTPVAFPVPPCLVWRCVAASLFLGRTGVGIATSVPVPASSFPIHSLSRWTSPCPMAYVMPPEQWQSPARLLSRLSLLLLLPYPFHASPNRPAVPFTRRAYVPPLRSAPRSRSCTPSEW